MRLILLKRLGAEPTQGYLAGVVPYGRFEVSVDFGVRCISDAELQQWAAEFLSIGRIERAEREAGADAACTPGNSRPAGNAEKLSYGEIGEKPVILTISE